MRGKYRGSRVECLTHTALVDPQYTTQRKRGKLESMSRETHYDTEKFGMTSAMSLVERLFLVPKVLSSIISKRIKVRRGGRGREREMETDSFELTGDCVHFKVKEYREKNVGLEKIETGAEILRGDHAEELDLKDKVGTIPPSQHYFGC